MVVLVTDIYLLSSVSDSQLVSNYKILF
jgi:hypothetical protein